jgi:hypothetical protein
VALSIGRTLRSTPSEAAARLVTSAKVWLVLVAWLVVVELTILFVPIPGLQADPRIGLFSWPFLALWGLAGLLGIWLASRTGFPAAWHPVLPAWRWLAIPFLIGMGFGLITIADELVYHWIAIFQTKQLMPTFHTPFPGSLLLYPGGAIIVEVLYRLVPIPLLLWLISSVILRGRSQTQTFCALAALTSLLEPAGQDLSYLPYGIIPVAASFLPDYAFNFVQAIFFRRYGFLAAIVVRLGDYLVWHILYGNFVCRC